LPLLSVMAEQRTEVSDIHADSVTVAPTQIVINASGSEGRGWTEALLGGPLRHTGLTERAQHAQKLKGDGDHAAAATEFEAIAEQLVDAGYGPAAEAYRERAAAAHAEAGHRKEARDRYLRLARSTLGDGSLDAQSHARRAHELSDADQTWEPQGLLALAAWPERVSGDIEAVRAAWELTQGTDNEVEWAAGLVELLILVGDVPQAREVAEDARSRHPQLASGYRLSLELDYIDLVDDATIADQTWTELANWISDPRLGIEVAGISWQRRGVALARRGDADAAHVAFLQAVQQWAREPGYDDQVAEAYFAGLSTQLALGSLTAATDDGQSLARMLRGTKETAAWRTERLLRRGLRALVSEKFPDAFRPLSVAMATARRAGNLNDYFEATEALGDCLVATGKYTGLALQAYVLAGLPDKAKSVTAGATVDEVLTVLSLDGPPWERRAVWAAIAGCKSNMSDIAGAMIADRAPAEEERESARPFPTNAAYYALESLGWAICAVPEAQRHRCLELLRDRLQLGLGDPKQLAHPLMMVTASKLADETSILVDAFLDDHLCLAVHPSQLSGMLANDSEHRDRLVVAARNGHAAALQALAFADGLGDDAQLLDRARGRVEAATSAPLRTIEVENGIQTVSFGIGGSLAPEGVMARACAPDLRNAFATKLLDTITAEDLPLMTRVSAVDALHNLAPALPDHHVEAATATLGRLAVSEDRPADIDQLDADEPLARFKINMAPPHALRAAAIGALGSLASHHPDVNDTLRPTISPAIASGAEPVIVAALHALTRHPELIPEGLDLHLLIAAPWPSVRVAALGVLVAEDPHAALAAAMSRCADPDDYVHHQLLHVASRLGSNGRPLLEVLLADRDCFVRASARAIMQDIDS